jgi:diguanylate cyclase (GGDEF)-like protein/PAS domain S-box-containing protein
MNKFLKSRNKESMINKEAKIDPVIVDMETNLTEVFEALNRISAGDPTVRISEESEMELMTKLKQRVNMTAKEIGDMVELSHEIAIGLAEHFTILHRVSQGDFTIKISGSSKIELLEALKNVTNQMIENIDKGIFERKKTTRALAESEEKYRSLVESTDDSIYVVDRDYKYVFINKKHLMRLGLSDGKYLGRSYGEFHSPEETQLFIEKADQVFISGNSIQHEYQSNRDGRFFLLTLSPVKGEDGIINAITVISKDITDHKMMEDKLRTLTLTDQLTGIYNRRGFLNLSEHQLRIAKRNNTGLYLLYLDLNNLKVINDQYGHKEGDNALRQIAQILKNTYRESDVIARIGGDEFAIIMHEGKTEGSKDRIIARLEQALKEQNSKMRNQYELSASIGVAYYDPQNPQTLDKLLNIADSMMYEQKRSNLQI